MNKDDLLYFHSSTCHMFQRQSLRYIEAAKNKFFPLYDNIESEIDAEIQNYEKHLNELFDPERHDPWDFDYIIYEKMISIGIHFCEMNGYIALLSIAGLYHLWEKQIISFIFNEMRHCHDIQKVKIINFNSIKNTLLDYGVDITSFDIFDDLNELRLVSNVIKHGTGESFNDLVNSGASILDKPEDSQNIFTGELSLSFTDIYPTKEHFERYGNAILAFWEPSRWQSDGEHKFRVRELVSTSSKKKGR